MSGKRRTSVPGWESVVVSGGFDPLHYGHVRLFKNAAKLGFLTVILNTDDWLMRKKGYVFMPFAERKEIIESIGCVDKVVRALDDDGTVIENLKRLRPQIFCNGGDRDRSSTPESNMCKVLGIRMRWNVSGTKVRNVHSSKYLTKFLRACAL